MITAHSVDLHALVNLPGAGRAAAALEAAGWRLPGDVPEGYHLFRVEIDVTVTRTGRATLIVAAEDELAALAHASGIDEPGELISVWEDVETQLDGSRAKAVSTDEALRLIRTERLLFEVDE